MEPTALARRIADIYLARAFEAGGRPTGGEGDFIRLPVQDLAARTGIYRNPRTGYVLRFSLRAAKLVLDLGRGIDLRPLSINWFRLTGVPVDIHFLPVRQGEVPQLEYLSLGDPPVVYEEVQVPRGFPQRALLENCAGRYTSEELRTTYQLVLRGDQLIVFNRHNELLMPLSPAFADGFTFTVPAYTTVTLRLKRDQSRRVIGFSLSAPRSYKIDFVKRAEGEN
jgi:hypothetical protein